MIGNPQVFRSWNVDQVNWYDKGWDDWSYQWYEDVKNDGTSAASESKGDKPADGSDDTTDGSLVIHALTSDCAGVVEEIGHLQLLDDFGTQFSPRDVAECSMFSHDFDSSSQDPSFSGEHDQQYVFGFGDSSTTHSLVLWFVAVDAGSGLVFPACCVGLLFVAVLLLRALYSSGAFWLLVPRCVDCCQGFPIQKSLWKGRVWGEDGGVTWYKMLAHLLRRL